ncbi:BON domain-containing protein [Chitinophaga sp.]|uniref:BON domain-containing protein n=1 Tax=Chitinophaga sp. TaxID=1869181 RepID=UPI002C2390B0|nr:BON domain-containing protein [Chitinophaga sp.]HWV68233.1 BON domain-containing protein [Chitinophaga sp.]
MTSKTLAIASLMLINVGMFACKPSDAKLKEEVNERLSHIPGITADVKKGVVVLSGEVSDEVAKSAAEDALKGLKGMTSVQDNITVKNTIAAPAPPPPPVEEAAPNRDDFLKRSLDSVYAARRFTNVRVTVSDGEVVLKGSVKKKNVQNMLKIANQFSPKKVTNNVQVK